MFERQLSVAKVFVRTIEGDGRPPGACSESEDAIKRPSSNGSRSAPKVDPTCCASPAVRHLSRARDMHSGALPVVQRVMGRSCGGPHPGQHSV